MEEGGTCHFIYIAISKLFCFMQNVVYFICDEHLLILREVITIFNFVQIVYNNNETIKYILCKLLETRKVLKKLHCILFLQNN